MPANIFVHIIRIRVNSRCSEHTAARIFPVLRIEAALATCPSCRTAS